MRKNKDGIAFENRCRDTVAKLLGARSFRPLPSAVGWDLFIIMGFPVLENSGWLKPPRKHARGKNTRFLRRDVDGPLKILLDAAFGAIDQDDSTCVDLHLLKRAGHGSSRVEFVLQEREVMSEEPNATEMAQEINSRPGQVVRVSPADHPALLRYCYTQVPDVEEVRLTHFDAWRLHIMETVLSVFSDVQDRLTCPARSGRMNACFSCSDMRVIDCVCSNPLTAGMEGRTVGLFDLCTARTGYHLRPTERRTEEIMSETTETPNAKTMLASVVTFLFGVDREEKVAGLRQARALLQQFQAATDTPTKEVFIQLGVLLDHTAKAGLDQLPDKPVSYYIKMTSAFLPNQYRTEVAEMGELKFAVEKFKIVAEMAKGAKTEGKPPEPAATPEPAASEAKGKKGTRKTKLQKGGGPDTSVPVPRAPAVAAPASDTGQLHLPLPGGPSAPAPPPPVVGDASVQVPDPGMPKMKPIEPTAKPGTSVAIAHADGSKTPVVPGAVNGMVLAELASQRALLERLEAKVDATNDYAQKLGQAFNALKKAVLDATNKLFAARK